MVGYDPNWPNYSRNLIASTFGAVSDFPSMELDENIKKMISRGYLFVHINKTGGSSVHAAIGFDRFRHYTVSELLSVIDYADWLKLFTFTIVRNPWDRLVSLYHWRLQTNQTSLRKYPITFRDWIDECLRYQNPEYLDKPKMFQPQADWISIENKIMVNKIVKFESISETLPGILNDLGLRNKPFPHLKKTIRSPYQGYYTAEGQELVQRYYWRDIEKFDYSF